MKVLVSEKLSEHKYKTPEGYLICTDAILARTGKQSYTKDELFQDGDNTEVNVDRPYDEVMNAKTIASFENKPITFDHPDEDVNVGNYKSYSVGYVRDVRQGKTDKGEDVILGNLVITDQDAINAIENGKHTDLSCGYDCDIKDDGHGNYSQNNIRGNHVALCEQGRAGIARIVDSNIVDGHNVRTVEWIDNDVYVEYDADERKYYLASDNDRYGWRNFDSVGQAIAFYKYNKSDVRNSILDSIKDSKVEDDETIDYKGIKIGVLHTSIGTLYEVRYNKNKADWPEYKKLENAKKYIDIFLTKGEQAANASWKIDDTIVDSKARDLVNDSDELVVGRWYEFAKKIEVARNQYAKSLRISGKSGNVYRYTIYLKNGEMYGSGTYSEIKERFNIKDSKVEDAGDYSWFKGHINGDLQSYNIDSLINNVKSKKQPLHTNLAGKSGNVYTVFIDGSLESNVDKGSNMWIDIIVEKPDGQQKRLISEKFNSWNECQKIFNAFKNKVRDSADDITRIDDSKINDVFGEVVWQKQDFTISYDKHHGYCVFYKDNLIESDYDNINDAKVNIRKYASNIEKFKKMFGIKDSVGASKVEDVNYSEKEIKEAAMKLLKQKPFLTYEEALQKVKENIKNGNYLLDSKARDSKITSLPPETLLNLNDWFADKIYIERKYNVKISNIYSNQGLIVTGSRQDLEKLYKDYHLKDYNAKIVDSKIKDAEYTYKLTKKKNDYDEYVIQAYKNGKKNEDATYYTDDWDDAINTLKSIAKQEKLTFRQQGSVFIADNKSKACNDSKESMTALDALKMIDLIKKVSK